MKLRGRFTLTLALVSLLPIVVAAVIGQQLLARRVRREYTEFRATAQLNAEREVHRLGQSARGAVAALASREHPLVGALMQEMQKGEGQLEALALRRLREQSAPVMRGLGLDALTIVLPNDEVVVAPHLVAQLGERAAATAALARDNGRVVFASTPVMQYGTRRMVLLATVGQIAADERMRVGVVVGKAVTGELLGTVRVPGRVDARIVAGDAILVPPLAAWTARPHHVLRVPLRGRDDTEVAAIEIAVSDGDLASVVRNLTLYTALLACVALAVVIAIGQWVARRMSRDLDELVKGSLAAARGDLDYRVAVRDTDEIGAVAAAFNYMMQDLRDAKERLVIAERIAAWQDMARRLAHEVKNPLTPIQMAMETLRKTWRSKHPSFDEIVEESTTTVLQEAERLRRIVSEFSDFARMPKPEFALVQLNDVIASGLALYQGQVEFVPSEIAPIDADRGQLQQVLLNLVENARDANAERARAGRGGDGKIRVMTRVAPSRDRIEWLVEDHGVGVPAELRDRVFAPYFSTKLSEGGTGLGLAIVHRIISDHGGRIRVSDVAGGGACFTIELPFVAGNTLLTSRV